MAWYNRTKNIEKKKSAVGHLNAMYRVGKPVFTPREYDKLAKEAYMKCITAYRCISLVASSTASVPISVLKNGEPIEDHPLIDLLKKPNPTQTGVEFLESFCSFFLLAGNAYKETVSIRNKPRELYVLRPERVKVVAGAGGLPSKYEYTVNNKSKSFPVKPTDGTSAILHMKTFHPMSDWYGMSPLEASAYAVDQHNEASQWNTALLQNGCRPSGALIYTAPKDADSDLLGEEQRALIKSQIAEAHTGSSNAGNTMLLEGGLDWKEMSLNHRDLDFLKGKSMSAMEIALAFNVPPQLVGVEGSLTFANYEQARLALYDDAVLPLIVRLEAEFNEWIKANYEKGITIKFDVDSISALYIRREKNLKLVNDAEYLTLNEKRIVASKALGMKLEARAEGDVFVDQNSKPISEGGNKE